MGFVKLQVGEQLFHTTTGTLKRFPNTLLGRLEEGTHFIDRSPLAFTHILNLYRTGILLVDNDLVEQELEYYELKGLNYDIKDVFPPPNIGFPQSWAAHMAIRSIQLFSRAMELGLRSFSIQIDPNGLAKGIPRQLFQTRRDRHFWHDFSHSFVMAPPGSTDDFGLAFREHFNVTLTPSYPNMVLAVTNMDGKPTEHEAVSWVVFRTKLIRTPPQQLTYGMCGLVLLDAYELQFTLPDTLTASTIPERVKTVVNGILKSEDVMVDILMLN
ncbi:hypothetical protein EDD86DRAFT_249241 [Gorgonomyces haynaldii]|nr:hypothetical protein EDD86DRAFT_249241 [Gorgonomyces haynaldii]